MPNSGLYIIENLVDGKYYGGSSVDLVARKRRHFRDLINNRHHNIYLQRAFNKNGREAFIFKIVVFCSKDALILFEQKWLDSNVGSSNCYNIGKFADCAWRGRPRIQSKETKRKIAQTLTGMKASIETRKQMSIDRRGKRKAQTDRVIAQRIKMNIERARPHGGFISPTGQVFEMVVNLAAFCRTHGLYTSSMTDVRDGLQSHHKGWKRYTGE